MDEFECAAFSAWDTINNCEHPDSSPAEQRKFIQDLRKLCSVVSDGKAINPFRETEKDLVILDTGEIMDPKIAESLKDAKTIGKSIYSLISERRELKMLLGHYQMSFQEQSSTHSQINLQPV